MLRAARAAHEGLIRDFGEVEALKTSVKGVGDFVSKADKRAEKRIFATLKEARPTYSFLMEESGEYQGSDKERRFIIDPLDGTFNFLRSIPQCAISIGYEERGAIVAGVIFDFLRGEMFCAAKGRGAYVNEQRIRASRTSSMQDALVATGIKGGQGALYEQALMGELQEVVQHVGGVRRFGSASLDMAWVAAGRLDAFWEQSLAPWDIAAGVIIAREAGALCGDYLTHQAISDTNLLKTGRIFVATPAIHRPMGELLRACARNMQKTQTPPHQKASQ